MGAGVAYRYPHHVILNLYTLYEGALPDDFNESETDSMYVRQDCERDAYEWFKEQLLECFGAWAISASDPDGGRDTALIGETDRLYIGTDWSGAEGSPCFYLKPKIWERRRWNQGVKPWGGYYETTEIPYTLNREADRGFNKLIRRCPDLLCYWTSAWTSSPYGNFGKSGSLWVKYSRRTEKRERHA